MRTVLSADGTPIAFDRTGDSNTHLVLVHGTAGNRSRWATIRPLFESFFSVIALDRRGRGDSGDNSRYAIEREFEDVAAVVNSLNAPVLLFGHSYGGICALEAAVRTDKLIGLILYEPVIGEKLCSQEQLEELETLLAAGDREAALKTFLRIVVAMPMNEVEIFATSPVWQSRVAAAHTLPRELRAAQDYELDVERFDNLSTPVMLLLGGDSPPLFRNSLRKLEQVLPNSRTVVMPGQQHIAMDTAPDLFVDAILGFWHELS
jgi:pimeloyl-ACP methyl ester carboxylesterase